MGFKNKAPSIDNIEGIAGMRRVGSPVLNNSQKKPIHPNAYKVTTKKDVELNGGVKASNQPKVKSLTEVLAEKRNKNHKQMSEARVEEPNKKISLQKALDDLNSESPYHGAKKKRN